MSLSSPKQLLKTKPVSLALIKRWGGLFSDFESKIYSLLEGSEKEFLTTGSSLQSFTAQAKEISDLSNAAAELTSKGQMHAALEDLLGELDNLVEYRNSCGKKAETSISILASILKIISSLQDTRGGFKRIVRVLRVLAISTRIESARLGSSDAGFNSLADDVEKLAKLIEVKYANIFERSCNLTDLLKNVLVQTEKNSALQQNSAANILRDTHSGTEDIKSIINKSTEVSSRVAEHFQEITRHIHQVITSLQFHDITRQQMEHVAEAFRDLVSRLDGVSGDIPQEESHDIVGWVGDVCEIESRQLHNAGSELLGAVGEIIQSLYTVSKEVETVADDTREIVDVSGRSKGTMLSQIEKQITAVIGLLRENAERESEMRSTMTSVAGTVGDMEGFVGDIEEIGSEIELIAMNARVKAAHTGKHGEALGVLAEAIQKLSLDARGQTAVVSETLTSIAGEAEVLHKHTDSSDSSGTDSMEDGTMQEIAHNWENLTGTLRKIESEFLSIIGQINESGHTLACQIKDAADNIGYHKVAANALESIAVDLEQVVSESRKIVPEAEIPNRAVRLKELAAKYTMQNERTVHQTAMGVETHEGLDTQPDDDLESNVELF